MRPCGFEALRRVGRRKGSRSMSSDGFQDLRGNPPDPPVFQDDLRPELVTVLGEEEHRPPLGADALARGVQDVPQDLAQIEARVQRMGRIGQAALALELGANALELGS